MVCAALFKGAWGAGVMWVSKHGCEQCSSSAERQDQARHP
jgi:hypothetical protein